MPSLMSVSSNAQKVGEEESELRRKQNPFPLHLTLSDTCGSDLGHVSN